MITIYISYLNAIGALFIALTFVVSAIGTFFVTLKTWRQSYLNAMALLDAKAALEITHDCVDAQHEKIDKLTGLVEDLRATQIEQATP